MYDAGTAERGSVEAVRRAAQVSGGEAHPIYAPMLLPDPATAAALRSQTGIARAFEYFDKVTVACVSIGSWEPGISTVHDMLSDEERAHYASLGVAAEMSAHLFDAEGRRVGRDLGERCITVEADRLRRIPEVVAIAGGQRKAAAIDAVLRSGLVTSLVTDTAAADFLLTAGPTPKPRAEPRGPRRGLGPVRARYSWRVPRSPGATVAASAACCRGNSPASATAPRGGPARRPRTAGHRVLRPGHATVHNGGPGPLHARLGARSVATVPESGLPAEARTTLTLIDKGGPFPYAKDGAVFGNFERELPRQSRGYYHEYTVPTPGERDRGARRIVMGQSHETYYTDDHYESFKAVLR